jgi:predicted RNA-binding protein
MAALTATLTVTAWADQTATAVRPHKSYTGMVMSVDLKEHELSLKKWMWNKKFSLGDACTYTMAGNSAGTINDVRPGQRVTVGYQDTHGILVADSVTQEPMHFDGTVKAADLAQHTLLLRVHGMDKRMQIANDCKVVLHNDKAGVLGDIQTGDYVTVTYEDPDDKPTAREIAQTSETFTGSLTAIDLDGKTVKARSMFETKKFEVGDNCAIVINGKPEGKLSDLKPKDKLIFNYDEIDGINVVSRIAPSESSPKDVVAGEPSGDN